MRKRKVLFLGRPYIMIASLLLSFVIPQAFGQWQPMIDGPNEIPAGELVVLTADIVPAAAVCTPDGECDATFDDAQPLDASTLQYRWQVLPPESTADCYRVCDDGRTLVFASRQIGCYHFVLAASDGERLHMVTHTLLNVGEKPEPVPLPPPDPEPDPQPDPQPEPQNTFEALRDWAARDTASLVRSDYFVREKAALTESMADVAARMRYGEITSAERARVELRVATRRKLDGISRRSTAAWQAWETELARRLSQLEQEGKLDSLEQLRMAFDAVAGGLSADQNAISAAKGGGR